MVDFKRLRIKTKTTVNTYRTHGLVNLRDNGIRLTHTPTGITVDEHESRVFSENEKTAWERLYALVEKHEQD